MTTFQLTQARLEALLDAFVGRRILIVGDLMLDEYVWGAVSRISPEAPVMVVEVQRTTHCLGGAGNVANNVEALGGVPSLVGVAGKDAMGDILMSHAAACGSSPEGVLRLADRPTTVKTRILAHSQQVVRVDRETRAPLSAGEEGALRDFVRANLPGADAVVLSDYAKGTLTDDLVQDVVERARRAGKPISANLKPPRIQPYRGATMLSMNLIETERAGNEPIPDDAALDRVGARLLAELGCGALMVTRGPDGVTLFAEATPPIHIPARRVEVYDVAGAGDAVISAATMAMAVGASPVEAAAIGNLAGNVKVTKLGVAPVTAEEIRNLATRSS